MSKSLAATLGAFALVAAACGGAEDSGSASLSTTGEAVTTEQLADLEAVFVPTAAGGQLDFNSLRGQDVLLWFWAPW
jgi:hypothetical protein